MTFADEDVRIRFHQLPTQLQVEYSAMEHDLADKGRSLHIADVRRSERYLEVVIRITENFQSAGYVPA